MNILIYCLYGVEILVCLLLALIVMLQKPKDGGLGGIAGGMSEAVFGADAGNVLIKVTVWLAAIFLVNTLIIGRLTTTMSSSKKTVMHDVSAPTQQQMPQLPAAPVANPAQLPAAPAQAPAAPAAAPKAPTAPAAPAKAPVVPAAAPKAPAAPTAPAAAPKAPTAPAVPATAPKAPVAPTAPAKK